MPRVPRIPDPILLRGMHGVDTFNEETYAMIRRIPEGKVASYGQIAELIGRPTNSRRVGAALKVLSRELGSPYLPQERLPTRERRIVRGGNEDASLPITNSIEGGDEARREGLAEGEEVEQDVEEKEEEDDILPPPLPNPNFVPWHRVLSSTGVISPRGNLNAVLRQADWLRAEGVEVNEGVRNGNGNGNGQNGARIGNGNAGVGAGVEGTVDAFGLGGAEGGRVSMREYRWDGRL